MGFGKGFDFYFEEYALGDEAGEKGGASANNRNRWEDVLRGAEGWLDAQKERVLLWFHYLDTHHLPECDLPEYFRFSRDPLWQFYEGKISHADACCVQAVVDLLLRRDRYEDALFIVLSDHGEELVPDKPPAHNGLLTEAVLRVPLVVFGEHLPLRAVRVSNLVRTADVVPTLIAGLVDLPEGRAGELERDFSGFPLPLPGLDLQGGSEEGKAFAYAENEPLGLSCLRSEQWKYVAGPEGEQLFHVPSDSREQRNVIDRNPHTAAYLREAWEAIRYARQRGEGVRAEREEEETRRLLRAFGYLE
jgi:arylsulfatase A-like enzyme